MVQLPAEIAKYYEDLEEMFATDGWKAMVEEAVKEIYQLQADALDFKPVPGVSMDWRLGVLQGKAEQLNYIARLQEISRNQKQQLIDHLEAEAAENEDEL